jgi:hypothetical protein
MIPSSLTSPIRKWHERLGSPDYTITTDEDSSILNVGSFPLSVVNISDETYEAYYNYDEALVEIVSESDMTDLDGNYTRLAEKALRISALFASLNGSDQIDLSHWVRAQEIAERWRVGLHELYHQLTERDHSSQITLEDKVLGVIMTKGSPTSREIQQATGKKSEVIEGVLRDLVVNGRIVSHINGRRTEFLMHSSRPS